MRWIRDRVSQGYLPGSVIQLPGFLVLGFNTPVVSAGFSATGTLAGWSLETITFSLDAELAPVSWMKITRGPTGVLFLRTSACLETKDEETYCRV